MPIKVVGIDLDGTLYSITPEIRKIQRKKIYEKISSEFEISFEKAEELFENNYSRIQSGSKTVKRISEIFNKELTNQHIIQSALEEADFLDLLKPNYALNEMLDRISQLKKLDLITGSRYLSTLKKLERLSIDFKIFRSIINGHKSNNSVYVKWMNQDNFSPSNYLYVGDEKKLDIDIPKSLGIKTCFIGDYDKADFCIPNILDLEEMLNHI